MREILYLMQRQVVGLIQILDGPGFLTTAGAGLLFTMDAGLLTTAMVGSGFPAMIGHQHGLTGAVVGTIMDGARCNPGLASITVLVGGYRMTGGYLLIAGILTLLICTIILFQDHKMGLLLIILP